ncbi:hypothetical protein FB451DRAFT_1274195 [Mycena latifolia]|nr:hypothetical protein FB451DRAFT_1274195 [Mycena latifolia]
MESQPGVPILPLHPTATQISQLRRILRSNHIPLETSHFRAIISSSSAELARHDMEVARFQAALVRAVSERTIAQAYVEGCHSMFAPIRRLPAELLVEIFFYFLPPFPAFPSSEKKALDLLRNVDILHLAHVCSYWRVIAMGTTALWSSIVIRNDLDCTPHKIRNTISLALQRSGASPLTIQLVHAVDAKPIAQCALEQLGQHSHRWRNICLSLPSSTLEIFREVKGNLPLLERIYIYGIAGRELDLFVSAPKLEAIICALPAEEIPSALPWGQLKTFEYLDGFPEDLPDLWDFLAHLSIGTAVSLDLGFETSIPLDLVHITSNLASIELHLNCRDPGHSRQVLCDIMKHATFPHMFQLWLYSGVEAPPPDWPHQEFLSLASRSSFCTNLTRLKFNVVSIPEIELLEVLSVLRALESLTIVEDDSGSSAGPALISNNFLRRLIYTTEPVCLVPALGSVVFGTFLQFDEHAYLDFVVSRLRPTRRFRSDILWLPGHQRELCADVMTKLEQLVYQRELRFVMEGFKVC